MKLLNDGRFSFKDLFIFEMANNHQGDLEHGKRIVRALGEVVRAHGVRAAVKLQFRDLDTFVHPEAHANGGNKHVQRFLETRLSRDDFAQLVAEIKREGLLTVCTPFDEPSVELIKQLGIEVLKIGSCSAQDWPLLEAATKAHLPMIVSTGGLGVAETDDLVTFLDHRYAHYALMHCVAIYPTLPHQLQLNQLVRFARRYPHLTVGFSTHEEPTNTSAIQMAYALGARMFEKHVGIATETIKLNAYSATPEQVALWIEAYQQAIQSLGPIEARVIEPRELDDLRTLQRGVFARQPLKKGELIDSDEVFFAFPIRPEQLPSGRWVKGLRADKDYALHEPLHASIRPNLRTKAEIVYRAVKEVKGLLQEAKIELGTDFELELSHHYGIERFPEVGTTIITVVNREYCKKLIIQLPGQQHPYHHHRKKEETFHVLAGDFWSELEGKRRQHYPGDVILVSRGIKHRFWSEHGAIVEEISTRHYNDDSIYDDPTIANKPREERKTVLQNWGRHQFE